MVAPSARFWAHSRMSWPQRRRLDTVGGRIARRRIKEAPQEIAHIGFHFRHTFILKISLIEKLARLVNTTSNTSANDLVATPR